AGPAGEFLPVGVPRGSGADDGGGAAGVRQRDLLDEEVRREAAAGGAGDDASRGRLPLHRVAAERGRRGLAGGGEAAVSGGRSGEDADGSGQARGLLQREL